MSLAHRLRNPGWNLWLVSADSSSWWLTLLWVQVLFFVFVVWQIKVRTLDSRGCIASSNHQGLPAWDGSHYSGLGGSASHSNPRLPWELAIWNSVRLGWAGADIHLLWMSPHQPMSEELSGLNKCGLSNTWTVHLSCVRECDYAIVFCLISFLEVEVENLKKIKTV